MSTVKVVIVGNSGVGKTSLRGQVHAINYLFVRLSLWESSRPYHSLSASTMSTYSASASFAPMITPARYAYSLHALAQTKASRPLGGPKLFLTSAKTGAGVSDVFEYVARRVVMRWEWKRLTRMGPALSKMAALFFLATPWLGGRT